MIRVYLTMSQGPPWSADVMHRNSSGSAVSRHEFLAEMPKHKLS